MLSGQSTSYRKASYRETTLRKLEIRPMRKMYCFWMLFTIFVWVSLEGCGGGGNGSGVGPMPEPNPVPTVTSVTPNSVVAGAPDTTVTISGSGFMDTG